MGATQSALPPPPPPLTLKIINNTDSDIESILVEPYEETVKFHLISNQLSRTINVADQFKDEFPSELRAFNSWTIQFKGSPKNAHFLAYVHLGFKNEIRDLLVVHIHERGGGVIQKRTLNQYSVEVSRNFLVITIDRSQEEIAREEKKRKEEEARRNREAEEERRKQREERQFAEYCNRSIEKAEYSANHRNFQDAVNFFKEAELWAASEEMRQDIQRHAQVCEAEICLEKGWEYDLSQQHEDAGSMFRKALEIFTTVDLPIKADQVRAKTEGDDLFNQGVALMDGGAYEDGLQKLQESKKKYEKYASSDSKFQGCLKIVEMAINNVQKARTSDLSVKKRRKAQTATSEAFISI